MPLRHEGEMYKTLLSDYDSRQRELALENAELKMVLHQMKKEIAAILKSRKRSLKGEKPVAGDTQVSQVVLLISLHCCNFPRNLAFDTESYISLKIV